MMKASDLVGLWLERRFGFNHNSVRARDLPFVYYSHYMKIYDEDFWIRVKVDDQARQVSVWCEAGAKGGYEGLLLSLCDPDCFEVLETYLWERFSGV